MLFSETSTEFMKIHNIAYIITNVCNMEMFAYILYIFIRC